ncbi:MAG: clan AA aspartic protease [Planctomycetota bacterium]
MGVFSVPIKLRNWQNQFLPPEQHGQEVECDAIVDSGAVQLALPEEVVEQLKLQELRPIEVHTADGSQHTYRLVGMVECEVQGRQCNVQAIELPRGSEPLLGAVPLEEMDWHISPSEQRLLPNPKSPDTPLLPLL